MHRCDDYTKPWYNKILNLHRSQVVLPDTDSRTVFRTSIAPVSKRSKDAAQPRRHKITCAADVMAVLDDLNEQVVQHSQRYWRM